MVADCSRLRYTPSLLSEPTDFPFHGLVINHFALSYRFDYCELVAKPVSLLHVSHICHTFLNRLPALYREHGMSLVPIIFAMLLAERPLSASYSNPSRGRPDPSLAGSPGGRSLESVPKLQERLTRAARQHLSGTWLSVCRRQGPSLEVLPCSPVGSD